LRRQAELKASETVEKNIVSALKGLKHAPFAVVTVANLHESAFTINDMRVRPIIEATMRALIKNTVSNEPPRDALLFASAQKSDSKTKFSASISGGVFDNGLNLLLSEDSSIRRFVMFSVFGWVDNALGEELDRLLVTNLDRSPQCTEGFSDLQKAIGIRAKFCRCAEQIIHTSFVLEQWFLHKDGDKAKIISDYIASERHKQVKAMVVQTCGGSWPRISATNIAEIDRALSGIGNVVYEGFPYINNI